MGGAQSCYNTIRSSLCKRRNADVRTSPENVEGVAAAFRQECIMERYGYTYGSPRQAFYRGSVVEDAYAFTVFVSPSVVAHISSCPAGQQYHIDGTFALPHGAFKQLVVIHLAIQNHVRRFL